MLQRFFQKFGEVLRAQIEQEIPPELAYCEFECRATHCPGKGWTACPILQRHRQQVKQQEAYSRSLAKVLERA